MIGQHSAQRDGEKRKRQLHGQQHDGGDQTRRRLAQQNSNRTDSGHFQQAQRHLFFLFGDDRREETHRRQVQQSEIQIADAGEKLLSGSLVPGNVVVNLDQHEQDDPGKQKPYQVRPHQPHIDAQRSFHQGESAATDHSRTPFSVRSMKAWLRCFCDFVKPLTEMPRFMARFSTPFVSRKAGSKAM